MPVKEKKQKKVECKYVECRRKFVPDHHLQNYCDPTHRRKADKIQSRAKRHEVLGRKCHSCERDDSQCTWSDRQDECVACSAKAGRNFWAKRRSFGSSRSTAEPANAGSKEGPCLRKML